MKNVLIALLFSGLCIFSVLADGPGDNVVDQVRPVPPLPKTPPTAAQKAELEGLLKGFAQKIDQLKSSIAQKPELVGLLPDVLVFYKSVDYALRYNEIFDAPKEVPYAKKQIEIGIQRANALMTGNAPWLTETGLVVRGYQSKLDDSIQPYGLVVPKSYQAKGDEKHRLDIWCHGRGETLSELNFIQQRLTNAGQFVPENAIVVHLYGRYCCANKLAGEVDCFETLDHIRANYRIDSNRIVMRGFSMGGAAAWHFAVHYPHLWVAAAPGAGFSETPDFLKVFQKETLQPTPYEQKLWHMYDCTDYALNLFNLPTVAYSGEIDRQKQAADIMAKAMKEVGLDLVHIIGPKTAHSYHPEAKKEIDRRIDAIVKAGKPLCPKEVKFTTWTLRYHQSYWLSINGMQEHWTRAQIEGTLLDNNQIQIKTSGLTAFSFDIPVKNGMLKSNLAVKIVIDGQMIEAGMVDKSEAFAGKFRKIGDRWQIAAPPENSSLMKQPGLQGPIDDAFLDRFLMVTPSNAAMNEVVGKFVDREYQHRVKHWRQQFRGDVRTKLDKDVTKEDIASSNLILWGDPASNAILRSIADKLPIKWTKDGVTVGGKQYDANHVPVMIYPNPLNPQKYVVINSCFTFREYDYLNNARQIPKLPDWAILDARTPTTSRSPATVVAADFFDENWQLKR
ncbi:MAG: prolyl oligopeptidase family serine peptidase [Zavarzinella sp.]